jgi:large subunit ribosomal protein L18
MDASKKRAARERRHQRLRKHVKGTAERPRLAVFRSNTHIYAQLIDDLAGHTLAQASSLEPDVTRGDDGKVGLAKQVGERIGRRAAEQGIEAAVFDRGGNRYAGRVAALADAARDAGLKF